jgi:hypothetical protein
MDIQLGGSDFRDLGTRINTELIKMHLSGPVTRINCTSRGASERPKCTDKYSTSDVCEVTPYTFSRSPISDASSVKS